MSQLPIAPCLNASYANLNRLFESYFNCGYRNIVDIYRGYYAYREIIEFLKVYNNRNISSSTVKRKF